jgi:predicted ATPase
MFGQVRLVDFKSHQDTRIELGRFTLLVGPNSSGKSAVLEAIQWIGRTRPPAENLVDLFGGKREMQECTRRSAQRFVLNASGAEPTPWRVEVKGEPPTARWIMDDRHWQRGPLGAAETKPPPDYKVIDRVCSVRYLKLDARAIARPSRQTTELPELDHNGGGLGTVLAHLKLSDDDAFEAISKDVVSVVPAVRKLRVERTDIGDGMFGDEVILDLATGPKIRSRHISEGTLIALALVTALHQASVRPRLLLLDDLHHGLHPRAQIELVGLIVRILDRVPDLQIVATTHSPHIVERVARANVVVLGLDEQGITRARTNLPEGELDSVLV